MATEQKKEVILTKDEKVKAAIKELEKLDPVDLRAGKDESKIPFKPYKFVNKGGLIVWKEV